MNIKSLLLGSAAALVAVSGARAADAVVMAEPEPLEYVRICDMYGAGFYYIPGTETCLKVGGYVRAQIGGGQYNDNPNDSYNWLTRAELKMDARNETEYGTLKATMGIQVNFANGGSAASFDASSFGVAGPNNIDVSNSGIVLDYASIELAGFSIGKGDSLFSSWTDYVGDIIQDGNVSYGPFDTNYIAYGFDFAGFSGKIQLEEGTDDNGTVTVGQNAVVDPITGVITNQPIIVGNNDELQSYVPHVVGALKYDAGFAVFSGVAAYDANNEEFAGKLRVGIKPLEGLEVWAMGGYKTDDGDIEDVGLNTSDGTNYYGSWLGGDDDELRGGDGYALWGGFAYTFTPTTAINGFVSYDEGEEFSAVANVKFQPVTGLFIQPEIAYFDSFDDDVNVGRNDPDDDGGVFGAALRIQRDF